MKTEYLVSRRKKKGLTQVQMSAALGVSQGTYAGYESGAHDPSIEMLCRMADFLDTTIDLIVMRHVEANTTKSA